MSTVVGILAGEASGDILGSHLMRALAARRPDLKFVGIGGPRMIEAGCESWVAQEKLAIRGLVEVLKHLREVTAIHREVVRRMLEARPRVFIGIDSPDTNLRIAAKLARAGVTTVHYVSPTIWAWRARRIKTIAKVVKHMLVLFPFESALYERAGVRVNFVGHPLADEIPEHSDREAAREQLRLKHASQVVALLPGSRVSEVELMSDCFLGAAALIHAARPGVQFLAPFVSRETRDAFERAVYRCNAHELPIQRMFGHSIDAMAAADVVLVASGTATLEAALVRRPMVIAYKLKPATYRIARRLVKLTHVGLPNILAGEPIVPEFLQDDATPENLAQALGNLLDDKVVRAGVEAHFAGIHASLKQNAAERAADALLPYLEPDAAR